MNIFKPIPFIFLIICFNLLSCEIIAQSFYEKINNLIQSNDYLELNRIYPSIKDSLTDDFSKNVIEGCIYNAMNCNEEAFKCYDYLINKYSDMYDMSNYLCLAVNNMVNMGLYKDAKQYIEKFYYKDTLQQNAKIPFPEDYPIKRDYTIAYALQDCPQSSIIRNSEENTTINMTVNNYGYWFINGDVNGFSNNIMIDTGASGNIVSEDFAIKHNITIFQDSIPIYGINGKGYAKIGFIDSIKIGNLTYQNVPVSVLPTLVPVMREHLDLNIDAILGFPFIQKVGIMEIFPKKKKIVFPATDIHSKPDALSNISIWSNIINIEVTVGPVERQIYIFDTGSMGGIDMPYQSFEAYRNELTDYDFKSKKIGMTGMTNNVDTTFAWKANKPIPVKIGGIKLKTQAVGSIEKANLQTVGVAFLNECDKITIDLHSMRIILE